MTAWLGVSPDMCEIEWDIMCICASLQDVCKVEEHCVCSANECGSLWRVEVHVLVNVCVCVCVAGCCSLSY